MNKDFKKTKYFKYLLDNFKEIENNRDEFNKEISKFLTSQTDDLGVVLKCHLTIEYYIDKYLAVAYPTIQNWQSTRLSFSQKLELINNSKTPICMYYQGIKSLNNIRNKFSHKLTYKIEKNDFKEIEKTMSVWYTAMGETPAKNMKLIQRFTTWVCGSINSYINGINKQSKELGLSGYLKWLDSMQEELQ